MADEFEPCAHPPWWHLDLDADLVLKMVALGLAKPVEYELTAKGTAWLEEFCKREIATSRAKVESSP